MPRIIRPNTNSPPISVQANSTGASSRSARQTALPNRSAGGVGAYSGASPITGSVREGRKWRGPPSAAPKQSADGGPAAFGADYSYFLPTAANIDFTRPRASNLPWFSLIQASITGRPAALRKVAIWAVMTSSFTSSSSFLYCAGSFL